MSGRFSPRPRRLAWAGAIVLAVILLALAFFSRPGARGVGARKAVDPEAEGVDLTYYDFDKENRKKLEVKCRESQKKGEDQLLMKGVTATIFNADKLGKDIRITADSGTASNDFNDFFLQGRARITSSDFSLASPNFLLKDLDILSNKERVDFDLKNIRGRSARGLEYFIKQKVLRFFNCRGTWVRDGKPHDFRCQVFWVMRKDDMLVLEKDAVLSGKEITVRSDWLSLQLDGDFDRLQKAVAIGSSSFRGTALVDGRAQDREISGDLIQMHYDDLGRLQRQEVRGNGIVSLAAGEGEESGAIRSEAIEILLDPETQGLQKARTLARGELSGLGGDRLAVAADSLQASYGADGTLAKIAASGDCQFDSGDFSGNSPRLDRDVANSRVSISGKGATVRSGKNQFQSSLFLLASAAGEIKTDKGVKATIVPAKKSVLLGVRPVFVSADGMESSSRKKATRFMGKVSLFQHDVELHAGELSFDDIRNRIACSAAAELKFISEGEPVALHGDSLTFDATARKIVIENAARMQQGPNSLVARKIELVFAKDDTLENIFASDQVVFSKEDIAGKAQFLHWQYGSKILLFKNAAEISRKGSGTTRGQELRFNLDSNEITVSSAGDRSETTIRREWP